MSVYYNEYYNKLSKLELEIAEKLEHLEGFDNQWTVEQTAEQLFVSKTSFYRFIKKVGYNNFLEFKQDFILKSEVFNNVVDLETSIISTIELLKYKDFSNIISLINNAHRIIIAGYGINHYISRILEMKLQILGYNAKHSSNAWYTRLDFKHAIPDDVLIIFSKSGTSDEFISVIKDAQLKNMQIILITELGTNISKFSISEQITVAKMPIDDISLDTRLQMHIAIDIMLQKLEDNND